MTFWTRRLDRELAKLRRQPLFSAEIDALSIAAGADARDVFAFLVSDEPARPLAPIAPHVRLQLERHALAVAPLLGSMRANRFA